MRTLLTSLLTLLRSSTYLSYVTDSNIKIETVDAVSSKKTSNRVYPLSLTDIEDLNFPQILIIPKRVTPISREYFGYYVNLNLELIIYMMTAIAGFNSSGLKK